MDATETIIIGAGQAGLAMSWCLTERRREHVVLEQGRVAERWRSERWESLRLLTPNWMSRLPGWEYGGPDPDGYMTSAALVNHLGRYAADFAAPVAEETTVEIVEPTGAGYRVVTDQGTWVAANVVIATGWCDRPLVPTAAELLSPRVHQTTPTAYWNPARLPDGGVLVVGASASGVQLADELNEAGRDVVVAVGRHTRLPRRYRGMDICWWLDRLGMLDKTIDEMADPRVARREPSLQLVGRPAGENLDLATLQARGVRLAGRLNAVDGHRVVFADDLARTTAEADARMHRMHTEIDDHVAEHGLEAEVFEPEAPAPVDSSSALPSLDLGAAGITTVLWATGFRRHYGWLRVPTVDEAGEIRHREGVTPAPGLYVLGQRFQHRRNSSFIDGVGRDAWAIADHLARRDRLMAPAARGH